LVKLQALPHVPQCSALVLVLVSQPLPTLPSQLPEPALQLMVQAPPPQLGVPFTEEHGEPQAPQWAVLMLVLVSQPLALLPSQLPKPVAQLPSVQTRFGQVSAALAKSQTTPQPLQSLVVVRLVSQPLFGFPSQLAQLVEQIGVQAPAMQLVVPWPACWVQAMPQPPQWVELVWVLVSQPFWALPSQFANPALQAPSWQVPLLQTAPALAKLQELPHVPQCVRLLLRLASQPVFTLPSQLPKPVLQAMLHEPSAQEAVPLVPLQALPQLPQLARFELLLVSQPSE
jgi:hypothetical protein